MHVVTTVVVIAAEITVIVAIAIATKTSRATVGALTAAVVTVVALTALTFTAAAVAAVQRLAAGASRWVRCRRNNSTRGWQVEQHCYDLASWPCELALGTTAM